MDKATERMNALSERFIQDIVGEAARAGDGFGGIMALTESCVLGSLLIGERCFGASRRVSTETLEAMVDRIFERLATEPEGGRLRPRTTL
jgi:hypothetical protein